MFTVFLVGSLVADENKKRRSDIQLDSRKQFCSVLEESDNYTQKKLETH